MWKMWVQKPADHVVSLDLSGGFAALDQLPKWAGREYLAGFAVLGSLCSQDDFISVHVGPLQRADLAFTP